MQMKMEGARFSLPTKSPEIVAHDSESIPVIGKSLAHGRGKIASQLHVPRIWIPVPRQETSIGIGSIVIHCHGKGRGFDSRVIVSAPFQIFL